MRTVIVFIAGIAGVATAATACGGGRGGDEAQRNAALRAARVAFEEAKRGGVDMARGPCLGMVATDWGADVAHDPRLPVDDEPANRCAAYRSGEAHHFVELDPQGNLIRAR
jgi:hypothetical protein